MEDILQTANPDLVRRLLEQHEKKKQYQREYRLRNKEYYARKQRERRQQQKNSSLPSTPSAPNPENPDADKSV